MSPKYAKPHARKTAGADAYRAFVEDRIARVQRALERARQGRGLFGLPGAAPASAVHRPSSAD